MQNADTHARFGALRALAITGLATLACAAFATSCSAPLGTDDVELVYRFAADPMRDTAAEVHLRLEAARVHADVELDGAELVHVRVDWSHELVARRTLEWSGDLEVYAPDPHHQIAGAEAHGLTWAGDHYDGDDDAVAAAVVAVGDDTDRLVMARADDGLHGEVVRRSPALTISADAGARGTDVLVWLMPDAQRDLAMRDDAMLLVAASNVVRRGAPRDWLERTADRVPVLVVPCGDDVRGYGRARRLAELLRAPLLPALRLVGRDDAPGDWPLAVLSFAIPLVTGVLWLGFLRRFDRAIPEPLWLVLATAVLGAAAQRVAAYVEIHTWQSSAYLDHRALALDHRPSAFPLSYLACVLVVGLVEEGAKLVATIPALRRREFDEPIDGLIYAGAAAIGFAVAENVTYFTDHRLDDITTVARSVLTLPVHVLLSAAWGYALGQRLVPRPRPGLRLAIAFGIAALTHAAYDTLLDFEFSRGAYAIDLGIAVAFAVMVRKSLRWGRRPAGDDAASAAASARVLVRVGRRGGAALAFATMIAMGYLLRLHAAAAYVASERITTELAVRGGVLVVLFGAAALALVRMLPLDVVLDDRGVTYAGAVYPWPDIRGCSRHRAGIVLDTTRGAVRIGPADARAVDELVDRITARTSPGGSAAGA